MKILIPILHRPTRPTGVCRHAVNLANSLSASDDIHDVTLLLGEWQRDYFMKSFAFNEKVKLSFVDIQNKASARNLWYLFGLPKLANKIKPDLIHMSFPIPFFNSLFDIPIVLSVHDLYPFEYPENFGYPQVYFNQLFLRQSISACNAIASVSQATLDSLQEYFPGVRSAKPAEVIYNLVDFSHTKPKSLTLDPNISIGSYVLTVAQHRKNKNLDIVIQAFSSLLKSSTLNRDTKLVIVGSNGPETSRLQSLITSLDIDTSVLFLYGLQDSELRWLYENADLFVIASKTEGFCLPLIEALSLSCPCICSDIPVLREVSNSQARYFQLGQNSCSNLAKAIADSYEDGLSRPTLDLKKYSLKNISIKLISLYQRILA